MKIKPTLKKFPIINRFISFFNQQSELLSLAKAHYALRVEDYLFNNLYQNARYQAPGMLNLFEKKVFSQGGEDGIIAEIFNRIGITDSWFVEFGVQDGLECNSLLLLHQNWRGLWVEGDRGDYLKVKENLGVFLGRDTLQVEYKFVTPENFERILGQGKIPHEFDLLSIDIDYNDYWVWKALTNYRPRVVVIEYNAQFPPPVKVVVDYNPQASYVSSTFFGASLQSLELLGREKGYQLVGCSFSGVNAFFVRDDLAENRFALPATAENFYEPARLFLTARKPWFSSRTGSFQSI